MTKENEEGVKATGGQCGWFAVLLIMMGLSLPSPIFANDAFNLCSSHQPPAGAAVSIPFDDAIHINGAGQYVNMFEEWYYNGLFQAGGQDYGFEALVFQFSFPPELFGLPSGYPQIIIKFSHQSLTDVQANFYKNDFIMQFDFSGAGFAHVPNGYDLHLIDPATGVALDVVGGAGRDKVTAAFTDGTELKLNLESVKNPLYSFFNGFGAYIDPVTGENHGEQFYYNRPWWLAVGSLDKPDAPIRLALGQFWQDRQFGTVIGTPGDVSNNVHWVWYSLRLNNGEQYHEWDMTALDTGNTLIRIVNRQGAPFACEQEIITDFEEEAIGTVVNPHNPAEIFGHSFSFKVPSTGLDGIFEPIISYPQVANTGLFNGTLEGAYKFKSADDPSGPAIGEGYVEEVSRIGGCCQ